MNEIFVRAQARDFTRTVELALLQHHPRGVAVARSVVMEDVEEGAVIPAFTALSPGQAQVLMDDLWNCGLRPSEGTGSAGALAATQEHLKDLRKLMEWSYNPKHMAFPSYPEDDD